jgi:hypothetical protein
MTVAISTNLLAPAAALIVWSLVMLIWMVALRLPALKTANLPSERTVGGRGQDLDKILPAKVNWPAHNYAHLMEQPTIFYPTLLVLALLGQGTALNVGLAWGYVGLRVIHSIWQVRVNTIPVRASIFFLSTVILIVLAVNALRAALYP